MKLTLYDQLAGGARMTMHPSRGAGARKGAGPAVKNVLVMDDEPMMRTAVTLMLESAGYHPDAVMDGEEALEHYRSARESGAPYDAVIMDLHVPQGLGGRETIRKLLELDPDAKAIIASGDVGNPVFQDYRTYGFMGVLQKPFTLEELVMMLGNVLHEKRDSGASEGV